jgi:hypothetical protein
VGLNVPAGFGARHGKVVPFALADGSVRAIRADINPDVLKALGTPRAGDKFDESDLDR